MAHKSRFSRLFQLGIKRQEGARLSFYLDSAEVQKFAPFPDGTLSTPLSTHHGCSDLSFFRLFKCPECSCNSFCTTNLMAHQLIHNDENLHDHVWIPKQRALLSGSDPPHTPSEPETTSCPSRPREASPSTQLSSLEIYRTIDSKSVFQADFNGSYDPGSFLDTIPPNSIQLTSQETEILQQTEIHFFVTIPIPSQMQTLCQS